MFLRIVMGMKIVVEIFKKDRITKWQDQRRLDIRKYFLTENNKSMEQIINRLCKF